MNERIKEEVRDVRDVLASDDFKLGACAVGVAVSGIVAVGSFVWLVVGLLTGAMP
ncbi:MAG: hypothetical protein ABW217_03925 [Polyangiaceae bacterium]